METIFEKENKNAKCLEFEEYNFYLELINSQREKYREIGYALLLAQFHLFPPEIKGYIQREWEKEKSRRAMTNHFVELCNRVIFH